MNGGSVMFVDPFEAPYFSKAERVAARLARRPALGEIAGYDVVAQLDGPHAQVNVVRRKDGGLWVLKGLRSDTGVSAGWQTVREKEALMMIRFGFGGILPLEQTLSFVPGGHPVYLCMPYCEGGNLQDRFSAAELTVAELAYHGLVLATAIHRLHGLGVMHGDIKPENVLFGRLTDDVAGDSEPRWQTWLSDLETVAKIGAMTNWRLTPDYAAPEQIAGGVADPSMDVWAWGVTIRRGLAHCTADPTDWRWLACLVEQAMATDPTNRPSLEQILEVYGDHIGFGDARQPNIGAISGRASAWYPFTAMPNVINLSWPTHNITTVRISLGWSAWLPECARLYILNTFAALQRIEELSIRLLGEPDEPGSVWHQLRDKPRVRKVTVSADASFSTRITGDNSANSVDILPRHIALTFVRMLVTSIVERIEISGAPVDLERLRSVTEAWESIGQFDSDEATAVLAQAWLTLDEPERALPYVRHSYQAAPKEAAVLATMRLYYVVTDNPEMAADVAIRAVGLAMSDAGRSDEVLRWGTLASADLLEACQYEELELLLDGLRGQQTDIAALIGLVLNGRRGPVVAEPAWAPLREHCATISSDTSIQKLRYLFEAAFQRGDLEYARRRANVVRARPAIRLPIHHQARAAIEAVALGRSPSNVSLTARLNNRAELWASDGRPDDPFLGLCFVAAQRWVDYVGSENVSAEAYELVKYSRVAAGTQAANLLKSERRCVACQKLDRVEYLSVCGHCHKLFCGDCIFGAVVNDVCPCGGDLAHTEPTQWTGLPPMPRSLR